MDKLDQNQREMAGKFQAIRAEWEAAIRDLQVAEPEEGPAETSSVSAAPILISREAAEQRRSVGSEPSSAGAMLDGPDSAKKTTAVAPKKRGRKAEGGGQKQDPDRNAVERQLRLLAKLQKNLSDKTGVDPPPSAGPDNGQGWQASKGWPASKGYQQKGHYHDKGWQTSKGWSASKGYQPKGHYHDKAGAGPYASQWNGWWNSNWGVQPERSSSSNAWDITPPAPAESADQRDEVASSGSKGYWWYEG